MQRFLHLLSYAIVMASVLSCQTTSTTNVRTPASDDPYALDTQLGEQKWPNEDQDISQIADTISKFVNRRYSEGRRPGMRDAHAKGHGCVKASFSVDNNLDPALAKGALIPGKKYAAWIRFSNGNSEIQSDASKDARGMAIKLMGVKGKKILVEEQNAETQDFVMINNPMFFIDDPHQYLELLEQFHSPNWFKQNVGVLTKLGIHNGKLALKVNSTHIPNPLLSQYWSMVPYSLGADQNRVAVKFSAKPCTSGNTTMDKNPNYNFLQYNMAETLSKGPACFNFYVQRFHDWKSTPIEQSTVEWKEEISPLEKVATIEIPQQIFNKGGNSGPQMTFCENLSYNPWHSLPEHKPLGAVNRTRRVVYTTISNTRHKLNGVKPTEPTGTESF